MSEPSTLHEITAEAVKAAALKPQDDAAAQLALRYAGAIDADPESLDTLGPKLLAVLVALGMAPSGRGAKAVKSDDKPVVNPLDELRARREKRAG